MLTKSSHFRNLSLPSGNSLSRVLVDEHAPPISTFTPLLRRASSMPSAICSYSSRNRGMSAPQPEMLIPSQGSFHSSIAFTGPFGQPYFDAISSAHLRNSRSYCGSQARSSFVSSSLPLSSSHGRGRPSGIGAVPLSTVSIAVTSCRSAHSMYWPNFAVSASKFGAFGGVKLAPIRAPLMPSFWNSTKTFSFMNSGQVSSSA